MSYFAETTWAYVEKMIAVARRGGQGHRLLVTIPHFPEDVTQALAETFTSKCLASNVSLTFKVAAAVWNGWPTNKQDAARSRGWLDETGSLTAWRNLSPAGSTTHLVVLCGVDRVTDAGSLADFQRCDLDTVWTVQMRRSFRTWVARRLQTAGLAEEAPDYNEFDRLLVPLLEHGRADLLSLSTWLETLDLAQAHTARDVRLAILQGLNAFGLPRFPRFPFGRKGTLGPYIEKAHGFFSYVMFLDARAREKALKTVSKVLEVLDAGEASGLPLDDEDVRSPYPDGRALLEGLRSYITAEDPEDRKRLMKCDFVTLIDRVLTFRRKAEPKPPREVVHKLAGSPVEVVLHAVWRTCHEFMRDRRFTEEEQPTGIDIIGDRFKHDYESSAEEGDAGGHQERSEGARAYLKRLTGGVDELVRTRLLEGSGVHCTLAPDGLACSYASTAEPQLEFTVRVRHGEGGDPFRRRFAWRLPDIQSFRLAEELIHWATDAIDRGPGLLKLPVFHVPHYEELLRATDDEETRRILLQSLRDTPPGDAPATNLLSPEWLTSGDVLLIPLKALAESYARFLKSAHATGLHSALFGETWADLRKAYAAVCRIVVADPAGATSQMTAMLLRAFLILERRASHAGKSWTTEGFERSGVATVMHPAVLEMLEAQVLFLFSSFNALWTSELARQDRRKSFEDKLWTGFVDLAAIQAPLVGLLYNEDQNLSTDVRGEDLIHRIGVAPDTDATLSTRLLLQYDVGPGDEDVTDSAMFRESRESSLLFRLMTDYFRLHPHARDGLSIAVLRSRDIQPVIAAVDQYLRKLADANDRYYVLRPGRRVPYAIGVTFFTQSGDDVSVARWLKQWRERWQAAETETRFKAYRECHLSVAHRIVEVGQLGAFQRLINDSFEADIAVLYDFIGAGQGGNKFLPVAPFDVTGRTLKFPILEKSCCTVQHPVEQYKRSRVISNRQFAVGTLHSEVMFRLKNPGVEPSKEFVVLGVGDFAPWRGVVDALHAKAEWVICIDPCMDERLIKVPAGGAREREIIGFSSGVGSHGEANFTISTEQFSLADVQARLGASVQEVYGVAGWSEETCGLVAKSVLREASQLSGLSLVRATGVGHYVREFMAYSLTRKLLRESPAGLCDTMVSLDAYRHWFDFAESERRPDLLWLTAWLDEDNRIRVQAILVECKLAQTAAAAQHLQKARTQITNGLRVLRPAFAPREAEGPGATEDSRPDQRYWWLQLHRLIASKAEIEPSRQPLVLSALERLADGDYAIEWGAAVFAFWSDDPSSEARSVGHWAVAENVDVTAQIHVMGSTFVRTLALEGKGYPKTWAQWQGGSPTPSANICDTLDDIELPPGDDDDEDAPPWDEDAGDDSADEQPDEGSYGEPGGEPDPEPEVPTAPDPAPPVGGPPNAETPPFPTEHDLDGGRATSPGHVAVQPAEGSDETTVSADSPQNVPGRILLGSTVNGGKSVYWEFGHAELANRHMLLFGTSGMGKTYAIQGLLCDLGRSGQNSLIIDYTDGFVDSRLEPLTKTILKPAQHYIRKEPLPINPFKQQVSVEEGIEFKDSPNVIAKRVGAIFKSVYDLGDQQFSLLIDAITAGVKDQGDAFTLQGLCAVLEGFIGDGIHNKPSVQSTLSKLRPFTDEAPFAVGANDDGWRDTFSDAVRRCHIFQFLSVDRHTARALIEFVLWDLYAYVRRFGTKHTPKVVVLDEVQNLDLGGDAPVAKYLTEGRKFGLCLISATQSVRGLGGSNDPRVSRLFQAEHKLFFKPSENEMREHAQLLHNAISNVSVAEWATRLASLQIGECWSLGRSLNDTTHKLSFQAQRIRIASLEQRGSRG